MKKITFIVLSLAFSLFISAPRINAADTELTTANQFCVFSSTGTGATSQTSGDVLLSQTNYPEGCVIYESLNGVSSGNLTIDNTTIVLHKTLTFDPGQKIDIINGGRIWVNTGGEIEQGKLCVKDVDNDHYAETKTVATDPNTGLPLSTSVTEIDYTVADSTNICPAGYNLRESMNDLTVVDNDATTNDSSKISTSDRELLRLGFTLAGVTDALAAASDVQIINKNMLICTGGICPTTTFASTSGSLYVAGNVGIGTTNPNYFKLYVNGGANFTDNLLVSTGPGLYLGNGGFFVQDEAGLYTQGDVPLAVYDNENSRSLYGYNGTVVVTNTGNVGIGVAGTPLSKLSVGSTGSPTVGIYSQTSGTDISIYGLNPYDGGYGVYGSAGTGGYAVYGYNGGNGYGVYGRSTGYGSESIGVYGVNNGSGYGVYGINTSTGKGGFFSSTSGPSLVTGNGNVGIGTAAPVNPLSVVSSSSDVSQIQFGLNTSNAGGYLTSLADHQFNLSGGARYTTGSAWEARNANAAILGAWNGSLYFFTNSGLTVGSTFTPTERMRINTSGNVGIGTASPRAKLEVSGSVSYTVPSSFSGAGSNAAWSQNFGSQAISASILASASVVGNGIYSNSDNRLKEDIKPIDSTLVDKFLDTIDPVGFTWKTDHTIDTGFIAQDLLKNGMGYLVSAVPDDSMAETTDADGFVSQAGAHYIVRYDSIIPILTAGLKNTNSEVNKLTKENENLRKEIDQMEQRLQQIEKVLKQNYCH